MTLTEKKTSLFLAWSGWWWMSQTNCLKMESQDSESNWPPSSWHARPMWWEEPFSAQPLHVMWRSGVNSTLTVLFWWLLVQGRCAATLWFSLFSFACYFIVKWALPPWRMYWWKFVLHAVLLTHHVRFICIYCISDFRNSAAETVEQELLFVGSETGKLTAMRELVKKVFWSDWAHPASDLSRVFCLSVRGFSGLKHCPDLLYKRNVTLPVKF